MPTTGSSSSRARSSARNEVLALLKEDHKRVKKAFRDFEKLDLHKDRDKCLQLIERTCGELEAHTMLEEELFYPAVRDCMKEQDLIDEAEVEHASARTLIEQLRGMSPDDDKFCATFTVLGEYVKHHLKEEEGEMFPQLARARIDWETLSERMHERHDALMEEHLPQGAQSTSQQAQTGATGEARR